MEKKSQNVKKQSTSTKSVYENFISDSKKAFPIKKKQVTVKPEMLNQKQRKGYEILQYHLEKRGGDQFLMVMTGKRIYNLDGPYV